jgi:hypothetical protein
LVTRTPLRLALPLAGDHDRADQREELAFQLSSGKTSMPAKRMLWFSQAQSIAASSTLQSRNTITPNV